MKIWNNYVLANSKEDAVEALHQYAGKSRLVAGGTDLLLEMQQGLQPPIDTLIDINGIPELSKLEIVSESIVIGAAVPVSKITNSEIVRYHAMSVAEATGLIGGPQVRNVATLGGNVAHALPAADGMIALVSLDASAVIFSANGMHEIEILNLFHGPGVSTLKDGEFIVAFKVNKKLPGEASAFDRVMRPQGVALPILNCSIWLKRNSNRVEDIRIAFGPSGPIPSRAIAVEETFRGKFLDNDLFLTAKAVLRETVRFRTSKLRASAEYRYKLAENLLEKVLLTAWTRALLVDNGE